MGTATVRGTRTLQRRRIIQRPRLLAQLDASNARVRMLIAPAGYGKTTLAEQWVATGERRSAWYTVRRASVDVAGLAVGLARACSVVVAGCDERLRAHLKAVSASTGSSTVLAEILCEDLADWPSDAWLVIDDYQEISGSLEAETFVDDLVSGCPLQIMLTSRQRPSWLSARSILYGKALEVGQASLAMDPQEAAQVLADWSGTAASGLVALANGWPAVIGLASVSSAEIEGEGDATVPESLYRFFADEVFDALGDDVREGLTLLAVSPVLDRQLADELLGEARAEVVCGTATDVGLLVERDSRLELHPLARSFLDERAVATPASSVIATCLAHYHARRDWDAAFDLIVRRDVAEELEGLLETALDDLLDSARLSTVEAWCEFGDRIRSKARIFSLARAEIALRQGRHAAAQAHAELAASGSGHVFRALSLAGRSAHLASREEIARDAYRRAHAAATNNANRRVALWGQLLCEIELELPEAEQTYDALARDVDTSDPNDFIRAAASNLSMQMRFGRLNLVGLEVAYELLERVDDPLVSSSFLSGYSGALALAARYDEALETAERLLRLADDYRLDFAMPYGHLPAAIAHAGRREWSLAEEHVRRARDVARRNSDHNAGQASYSVMIRVLAQQGRYGEALSETVPDLSISVPGQWGEALASRALALAASGHPDEALKLLPGIPRSTKAVEATVLVAATKAIAATRGATARDMRTIAGVVSSALSGGAPDLLVTTYRASPELLRILLRAPETSQAVAALVKRVRDDDLAQHHRLLLPDAGGSVAVLTPREREIHELLLQGFSSREIAELLFIEKSTVKVHTHHIYEKLGVHSRAGLAIQASLARRN
jgi:DNA-binding NarL/FixJ family response regulator/tetratricopeptide (TPR) repeat protein